MPSNPALPYLKTLRIIGFWEGISYLILLLIAMPLKHIAKIPEAVRIVGMAHGVLFVLFCMALAGTWYMARWSFWKAAKAFAASLIPFGTFWLEREIKKEENGLISNL